MINTEDPPKTVAALQRDNPALFERVATNYKVMEELQAKGQRTTEDGKSIIDLAEPIEEWLGEIHISEDQVAYFEEVLEAHPDVRWTFCFTHAPPHYSPAATKRDPGNFPKIEILLADRPYTVFSAHTHTYDYDLIEAVTSSPYHNWGAMNVTRPGAMDHIVWVTITDRGPKIVNLLMSGIIDKKGPPKDDDLAAIGLYRP